jgi:CRISPR system Cascade subunit CasC
MRTLPGLDDPNLWGTRSKLHADAIVESVIGLLPDPKPDYAEVMARVRPFLLTCLGSHVPDTSAKTPETDETDDAPEDASSGKAKALLFLSKQEIEGLAKVLVAHWATEDWDALKAAMEAVPKDRVKKVGNAASKTLKKDADEALDASHALDIAIFGRFLAGKPDANIFGASRVAHAISTHTPDREFDFFTAIDDLRPQGVQASDMIGTVEFNSATFYRHAALDLDQLVQNLGGNKELAIRGAIGFLNAFVLSVPKGMERSMGHHTVPGFVFASVRKDSEALNLCGAFEVPLRENREASITCRSAQALVKEAMACEQVYGIPYTTTSVWIDKVVTDIQGFGIKAETFEALLKEVEQKVQVLLPLEG